MKTVFIRNTLLYFRNRSMVFFSMFSVFVSIAIYSLFIGRNITLSFSTLPNPDLIAGRWLLGGILSISSVTVSISSFSIMVRDKYTGALDDFYIAPVKKYEIAGGFILSSFFISAFMCFFQIILFASIGAKNFNIALQLEEALILIFITLVSSLFSASMSYFFSIFFKNPSTYGAANSLISTLIGFTNGVFIDIGSFPDAIMPLIKVLPTTHIAAVFRKALLKNVLISPVSSLPHYDLKSIQESIGTAIYLGEKQINPIEHLCYIAIWIVFFFILSLIKSSSKQKKI